MYHSQMIQHFNKYKFDACYRYDRQFRLSIANQRKLSPDRQTTQWTKVQDDIRVKCLMGHELSRCEYCQGSGHTTDACRQKLVNELKKDLPQQIATAIHQTSYNTIQVHQSPSSHPSRPQNPRKSYSSIDNNNNNTYNNIHNTKPPNKKGCRYWNAGQSCQKPPCMFHHGCANCGNPKHTFVNCSLPPNTTTNFFPG